ncbi:MAG TPA: AsmA family protein [Methylophilaceae bacterium]|nr:AsmA family protein [Methylophilaceae bacterium]
MAIRKLGTAARILLGTLAALLIALIVCEVIGWPFLRLPAERFMEKQLERSVRLDAPFRLHLLGGVKLNLGGLWISAPEGFKAPYLIDAKKVNLELRYSDLFKRDNILRIKVLKVSQMDAYLERHKDGKSSWQFPKDESKPERAFPRIATLVVEKGTATVDDQLGRADLKLAFATTEGRSNAQPVSSVRVDGELREHPIKGEVVTNGFLPVAAQESGAPPIQSKGWIDYGGIRIDFDGSVSDLLGDRKIKAKFDVKGPSLGTLGDLFNIALPTTEPFQLKGDANRETEVLQVNISTANVGESDLAGSFKYDSRPKRPRLEGDLRGKKFVLADLGPTFGMRKEDDGEVEAHRSRIIPNRPLNLPTLNRFDAKVAVNLDRVELGRAFARPITPFKAQLSLDAGNLALAKVYARTADGTLSGTIAVDAHELKEAHQNGEDASGKKAEAAWRIDLAWKDIELGKWLQVSQDRKEQARREGKKDIPDAYITGTLNGKTKLSGKGHSTADLLSSLDGEISMYVNKGSMSHLIIEALGLDVAQALGLIIKGDESLPMHCAIMDFKSRQGVITPNVALIDTPVTLILVDGNVSLAKERLALRMAAKPKNVSPFTVRSPLRVTGTFLQPKVRPEATPIAARILGSVALAFVNPLAAILPFIDPGSAQQSSCASALAELKKQTK